MHIFICVSMYVCMYVCMYACMHACMHGCMYVCMYAWMYVCMHACMKPAKTSARIFGRGMLPRFPPTRSGRSWPNPSPLTCKGETLAQAELRPQWASYFDAQPRHWMWYQALKGWKIQTTRSWVSENIKGWGGADPRRFDWNLTLILPWR